MAVIIFPTNVLNIVYWVAITFNDHGTNSFWVISATYSFQALHSKGQRTSHCALLWFPKFWIFEFTSHLIILHQAIHQTPGNFSWLVIYQHQKLVNNIFAKVGTWLVSPRCPSPHSFLDAMNQTKIEHGYALAPFKSTNIRYTPAICDDSKMNRIVSYEFCVERKRWSNIRILTWGTIKTPIGTPTVTLSPIPQSSLSRCPMPSYWEHCEEQWREYKNHYSC